jgi:hypothetical protein
MEYPTIEEIKMNRVTAIWMMDSRRFPEIQADADLAEARDEAAFEADRTPTGYYHNQASQYNSPAGKAIRDAALTHMEKLIQDRGYDIWGHKFNGMPGRPGNFDSDGPPDHPNCYCDPEGCD